MCVYVLVIFCHMNGLMWYNTHLQILYTTHILVRFIYIKEVTASSSFSSILAIYRHVSRESWWIDCRSQGITRRITEDQQQTPRLTNNPVSNSYLGSTSQISLAVFNTLQHLALTHTSYTLSYLKSHLISDTHSVT